jgi:hypothetical protein
LASFVPVVAVLGLFEAPNVAEPRFFYLTHVFGPSESKKAKKKI